MKRYFIGHDQSAHRYIVDADFISEWREWNNLDEDSPAAWETPHFARRIDGGLVTFENPTIDGKPFAPTIAVESPQAGNPAEDLERRA